jgi:DNA-binding transcriptional LysR family regulator
MTKAADELHMTQSGVSQHIKLLEEVLNTRLFDRIKQRLVPTGQAELLFEKVSQGLYDIEKGLTQVTGGEQVLTGKVTIGVPIEFGNQAIVPRLATFGLKNPNVSFKVFYGFASEINDSLLKGEIDFAFLDDYVLDKQIETKVVFNENLTLVASRAYLDVKGIKANHKTDKKFFESLDYIAYMDDQPVIRTWLKHHYDLGGIKLNARATMMDVQGVAQMIVSNLGVGIIPKHVLESKKEQGFDLYAIEGAKEVLDNSISIAYVKGRTQTPTVQALIENLEKDLSLLETL